MDRQNIMLDLQMDRILKKEVNPWVILISECNLIYLPYRTAN